MVVPTMNGIIEMIKTMYKVPSLPILCWSGTKQDTLGMCKTTVHPTEVYSLVPRGLYCTVLYCAVLYRAVLYCAVLYCAVLYCAVLYCAVLYRAVLYCAVLYCAVLYCAVLYCTVLYCTAYISVRHSLY